MPASSQRQAGEVSWLDSGACPSCLMMWWVMGARESVGGLHTCKSRKLQLVQDSTSDSMAVSAVVLCLALAATQTQLPIVAFSSKPRDCTTAAREHLCMLRYLQLGIYTNVTRMLVRETLHFRHCKVT